MCLKQSKVVFTLSSSPPPGEQTVDVWEYHFLSVSLTTKRKAASEEKSPTGWRRQKVERPDTMFQQLSFF